MTTACNDERYFFLHEMRESTHWQPDLDALRSLDACIVVGLGDDSSERLCDLTSHALAEALGRHPTRFPGGHVGFLEDPDAFASRLRSVLAEHRP